MEARLISGENLSSPSDDGEMFQGGHIPRDCQKGLAVEKG